MFNWLKSLFIREEVRVKDLVHSAAASFELSVMDKIQDGVYHIWEMNREIDDISENIAFLMQQRQKMVTDRSELILSINKQRQALDMEPLNDEGVVDVEPVEVAALEQ